MDDDCFCGNVGGGNCAAYVGTRFIPNCDAIIDLRISYTINTESERGRNGHVCGFVSNYVASGRWVEKKATLTHAAIIPKPFHKVRKFGNERIFDFICILGGIRTSGARQEGGD